jgi:hypothetical protein
MAAPRSVSPVPAFTPSPIRAPIAPRVPPAVGDTELPITSLSPATTCGRAADSEARKNRLTPRTSRTATYSGTPRFPAAMSAAVITTNADRSRAEYTRIWRRDQRSMKTPANGPISEYGPYSTANAAAPLAGSG